ncbi:MAG: LCP family protein [Anaerolineae bacterium]|nr:LCP family protein [Anaerolineae bacterium]
MPLIETTDEVVNFLLLGSDTSNPQNSGRTDVILIVSVHPARGAVAFLSVPRDLYVYIPGWRIQRINTAYAHGEMLQQGQGPALLMETLQYNLGIQINHFARVDFGDFVQIIDAIGGVDIAVDCAIEDWRLRELDLDPTDEANWQMSTLPIGVHHLDGNLALWYARSRRTSSDIDRGQRQQELLRAMWRQIKDLGLLSQLPDIWPQLMDVVETDISLPAFLTLLPLALNLQERQVASYTFRLNADVSDRYSPEGERVLVPKRDAIEQLMRDFLTPPTISQLQSSALSVQITNASGNPDLAQIVADKLTWKGFQIVESVSSSASIQHRTVILDYTGRQKGSGIELLRSTLGLSEEQIVRDPDPARKTDYAVTIGSSYYPCTRNVLPPAQTTP